MRPLKMREWLRRMLQLVPLLLVLAFYTAVAAPPNDHFETAHQLAGEQVLFEGDLTGATLEAGERHSLPWWGLENFGKRSVWWKWTASREGGVVVHAKASRVVSKAILIYEGNTLSNLTLVATAFGDESAQTRVTPGTTYSVAVISTEEEGLVIGSLRHYARPANDDFAARTVMAGPRFTVSANLFGTTMEQNEPGLREGGAPFGNGAWWEWTSPTDGGLSVTTSGAVIELFEGTTLGDLRPIPTQLPIYVRSGQKLLIRLSLQPGSPTGISSFALTVDGVRMISPLQGSFELGSIVPVELEFAATDERVSQVIFLQPLICDSGGGHEVMTLTNPPWAMEWETDRVGEFRAYARVVYASGREQYVPSDCFNVVISPPPNDARANATVIPANGGKPPVLRLSGATMEPGEGEQLWEAPESLIRSAWWKWVSSETTSARLVVSPQLVARIFLGDAMTRVPTSGTSGQLRFTGFANQTYWIGLRPTFPHEVQPDSELELTVGTPGAVANDLFSARAPLNGSGRVSADFAFATREVGEPGNGDSFWWTWTATEDGILELEPFSIDARLRSGGAHEGPVVVTLYRGSSVDQLTEIPAQILFMQRKKRVRVTRGETIVIRLAFTQEQADRGAMLRYQFLAAGASDAFAERPLRNELPALIRGRISSWDGGEPGEPWPFNGPRSVWCSWTSPISGEVGLGMHGDPVAPALAVFEGTELASLKRVHVVTNQSRLLLLAAEAGRTYQFQISGSGDYDFLLHISAGETNDHFANSTSLNESERVIAASNLNATHEAGEATHLPPSFVTPLSGSLWYHFTTSVSGELTLRHRDLGYGWRREWRGDALEDLQQLPRVSFNDGAWVVSRLSVPAETTVRISLDSLANPFTDAPLPQSVILEHDFTTVHLSHPTNKAEYGWGSAVEFRLGEVDESFDGEIEGVVLRFRKQRPGNAWDIDPISPVMLKAEPFVHAITNLNPGTYEVTVQTINSEGDIRTGAPRLFTVGPQNDAFAERVPADIRSHVVETMGGTSLEAFETNNYSGTTGSAWWQWKALWSGRVYLETSSGIAVYRGTNSESLEFIGVGLDGGYEFEATQDEVYQIALLRRATDAGTGAASFRIAPAPENDFFAKRKRITIYEGPPSSSLNPHEFNSYRGTLEAGEPTHAMESAQNSIWWEFSVARPGILALGSSSLFQGRDAKLFLYRGSDLAGLAPVELVEVDDGYKGATLEPGTYQLAFVSTNFVGKSGNLSAWFQSFSTNDNFGDAATLTLSASATRVAAPFWFGTVEAGEPHPYWFGPEIPESSQVRFAQTLWWKWVAPASGVVEGVIPAHWNWSPQSQYKLEMFQGDSLGTLQKITPRSERREHLENRTVISFEVAGGVTYYLRAGFSVFFHQHGTVSWLDLVFAEGTVPNDAPEAARQLSGSPSSIRGNTAGARGGTLYYSWRAPAEGLVTFSSTNSDVRINIDRVDAIRGVVANAMVPPTSGMHARPGDEFVVAVTTLVPAEFEFSIKFAAGVPNDEFASRQILTGHSGSFTANPLFSSGTFGPNGEATSTRHLYYEWIAPEGGKLWIETTDGTPASWNMVISEMPQGSTPQRVVAGRSYLITVFATEPRGYIYWLETGEWQPLIETGTEGLDFSVVGPPNSVVRVEDSDDLQSWRDAGLRETVDGRISLERITAVGAPRFFRITPLW